MPDPNDPPVLLLTGFEPFGRFAVNPSARAAAAAAEAFPGRVVARCLPVDYHAARASLLSALAEVRPFACLCTGLAPGDQFRLEQIARKPSQFADLPGHAVLQGTWQWYGIEAHLRERNLPVRRSVDAGQYVCESTYWCLLDAAATGEFAGRAGFLHVPAESDLFSVERTVQAVLGAVGAHLTITSCSIQATV